MSDLRFDVTDLVALLGRSVSDPQVVELFAGDLARIERDEQHGFLELLPEGVDAVFQEVSWVGSQDQRVDQSVLRLVAFHFHSEGHEGYRGYPGTFPGGLRLGDPEARVLAQMGAPTAVGGGGMSTVLKRPIPRWFWYAFAGARLHFQLDASDEVDLVTLYVPVGAD